MQTLQMIQLDDDTRKYLRFVRSRQGQGCPGVFITQSTNRPLIALIVGAIILPLFIWTGYTSTKPGWAVAMLQTAGLLGGGWLIVYAFRRWLANPETHAGKFIYCDPKHVYLGLGEDIQIAELGDEPSVEPNGTHVRFETRNGAFNVPVENPILGQLIAGYYESLKWVLAREEGPWVDISAAEAGAVALYLTLNDEEPRDVQETGLEVEELPESVSSEAPAKSGLLRYGIVAGLGALMFVGFSSSSPAVQDNQAFTGAKDALGKDLQYKITGAGGLRDYLLNERNTRHRDEAKELLAKLYDRPIQLVENMAQDEKLKAGMVALLNSLRGPETPAVSIRCTDQGKQADAKDLATRLSDGIGEIVGKDMIVFVQAPADKKAMLDIEFTQISDKEARWTVAIRLKADDETATAKVTKTASITGMLLLPNGQPLGGFNSPMESIYSSIMMAMIGQAPAPPKDDFGGDF